METISFRLAKISDAELLLDFMRQYYDYDGIQFDRPKCEGALRRLLTTPSLGESFLIERNGEAVGYIVLTNGYSLEFGGVYQYIDEFFIVESSRGQSLGRKTLEFIEQSAKMKGVISIHLEVETDNFEAQGFYKKLGYAEHGRYLLSKPL